MIVLDTSTALEIALSASAEMNELEFQASYIDVEGDAPGYERGLTSGTADVTLIGSPSSGMRLVKQFTVFNSDSNSITVYIKLDDGTSERQVVERSIQPGQTLCYDAQAGGFYIAFRLDATELKVTSWVQDDGLYIGTDQIRARDADGLLITDNNGNGLKILDGGGVETTGGVKILDQSDLDSHAGTSDAHHTRYSDSEAIDAINNDTDHGSTAPHNYFSGDHSDLSNVGSSDHHTRYTDSEAVSAVNAETSLSVDITGDSDTVDGYQTETQPGQGAQAVPVANSEGYIDQGWIFPVYGVRWDSVNDVMQPGLLQGDTFIAYDYQSFPIQEKMGRGLLTNEGAWTKLDPNDSSLKRDGSAATLDGTEGQTHVYIPRFHAAVFREGDYVFILNSEQPFTYKGVITSWVPRGFRDLQQRYCGAFEAVAASDSTSALAKSIVKDTSGYSMSYPNPFTNRDRGQFRTQCNDGIFHQFDYGLWEITVILFLTEFKTWNSQDVLPGYTWKSSWDYSYTYQVGQTVSLGDKSGTVTDGSGNVIANSFRGIENIFGHVWKWIDGINIDNRNGDVHIYVAFDPANFANDTTSGYIDTGHAPGFGDSDDYIKDILGQGELCPFYPSELGGGSSSYITDYNFNNSGAWRGLRVGGHLSNGARAGLAFLNGSNASSVSHSRIGARSAA